eukprot:Colp12_sorted_trinity150504_noHs@11604
MEDSYIQPDKGDSSKLRCVLCDITFSASNPKLAKQHIKSKTHKSSMKNDANGNKDCAEEALANLRIEGENRCKICDLYDDYDLFELYKLNRTGHDSKCSAEEDICIPPPVTDTPKKELLKGTPFVTLRGPGSIQRVPKNLGDSISILCKQGGTERVPNLDVDGTNVCIKSWSHARKVLEGLIDEPKTFWISFMVGDELTDPVWWPKANKVPTYSNVIIGSGGAGIGMHIDVDHYGPEPVPVDTYLCMQLGCKRAILLPPTQKIFKENDPFPEEFTADLIENIQEAGGYVFDLMGHVGEGVTPTLFIPKGWFHCLIGVTDWHVVLTASKYR